MIGFPKRQILDSPKLKEFADNSFKVNENFRKFFKRVENTVGKSYWKRRKCCLPALAPFPTMFSKVFF